MERELDRQIALEVLGDPIPPTNEGMRDFGLGMGNGYMGPHESPGNAWVLDWNPEYFRVQDDLFRKWPKFVYRGGREGRTAEEWKADQRRIREDPDFQKEYEEYKKLLPAAWRPREFSKKMVDAMWAFEKYNVNRDLSFNLTFDGTSEEWYGTVFETNNVIGDSEQVMADTAEEALMKALLDYHRRKEEQ